MPPRLQSGIAISADDARWFLINASPDLRAQIEGFAPLQPQGLAPRHSPIEGVLLTNADLDHTLGLFLLRGHEGVEIHAAGALRETLESSLGLSNVLGRSGGVLWHEAPRELAPLRGRTPAATGLRYRAIPLPANAPHYVARDARLAGEHSFAYEIIDEQTGGRLVVAPDVSEITPELRAALATANLILFDGTFWTGDELQRIDPQARTASAMGHLPVGLGSLPLLHRLRGRRIYLHINNTNPILRPDSAERRAVEEAGVEIGEDGMELTLGTPTALAPRPARPSHLPSPYESPQPVRRSPPVKIVVLDGYTANPGDLSWAELEQLGESIIHDRSPEPEVIARAQDAEIVLTNKTPVSRATIAALPRLRYLGVLATGYNVVDTAAAAERGIPVCNVPEYSTPNVAQAVFALLLELTNRTGHHARTVREGRWSASKDFCYWDGELIELAGRTLGLVGYGRIGKAVARIAQAFGMRVLASRRQPAPDEDGVHFVDVLTLLAESDVVSLHCPLTPETKELIDAGRLALMKPSAFLINTARGALVQEADLAAALEAGKIAGAALDVLSQEPPPPDNPLLRARNCLITPHIAWATREARARLLQVTVENVRAWQNGAPQNVVNR